MLRNELLKKGLLSLFVLLSFSLAHAQDLLSSSQSEDEPQSKSEMSFWGSNDSESSSDEKSSPFFETDNALYAPPSDGGSGQKLTPIGPIDKATVIFLSFLFFVYGAYRKRLDSTIKRTKTLCKRGM